MKKIKFIILSLIIVIVCILLLYFFIFDKKQNLDFITTKPTRGDLSINVITNGEVMASNLVSVGAEVSGQIKKLYIKLGDKVKKGDLIAEIDSVKQQNEVDKANIQLKIYEANLKQITTALDIAKKRLQREQKLYKLKASSAENIEELENSLALQESNLAEINAKIEQAKIELDTAQTDLAYTKITSPLDGVVVSLLVKEGQTLNAMQTTPTIAEVADLSKMQINLEVSEADIPKIKVGMKVLYKILAYNDIEKNATITSIDPAVSTLSDGTYSSSSQSDSAVYYYAKADIDNSDGFLKIGMTTENTIVTKEAKDTLYIPTSAIKESDGKKIVYILQDNKAVQKEVKTGMSDSINSQIISGIDFNDNIILSNPSGEASNVNSLEKMPRI